MLLESNHLDSTNFKINFNNDFSKVPNYNVDSFQFDSEKRKYTIRLKYNKDILCYINKILSKGSNNFINLNYKVHNRTFINDKIFINDVLINKSRDNNSEIILNCCNI